MKLLAHTLFFAVLACATFGQITPESQGAKGDGRTDDSQAFIKANAVLAALGGGQIVCAGKAYVEAGVQLASHVVIVGVPHAPMLVLDSPTALAVPCTVLRSPLGGGVCVTINGTPSAPVVYAGVENIVFEGPANASSIPMSVPSQGLLVGANAKWPSAKNVTCEFFGDQGMVGSGTAFDGFQLRTVYDLRKQPRPYICAGAEFYGTDPKVLDFEFSGEIDVETAMVDPTRLYNAAMLVQSTQGFYSMGVVEAGDIGIAIVGKAHAVALADGSDAPGVNYNNKFSLVRADHNWGDGWAFLTMNGSYVYDATASNCWADGNGQDRTSLRTSLITGALSSVSDANWVVQGVRVTLSACSSTSYEMTPPNLNYGIWMDNKPGPIDAFNTVSDFTASGESTSYLIAPSMTVIR